MNFLTSLEVSHLLEETDSDLDSRLCLKIYQVNQCKMILIIIAMMMMIKWICLLTGLQVEEEASFHFHALHVLEIVVQDIENPLEVS